MRSEDMRVHPQFKKVIKQIQLARIKKDKSKDFRELSSSRITLAFTRHPDFIKVCNSIIEADFIKEGV